MVPSATDLLVLHGLRLKGFVEAPELARALGLDGDDVARALQVAADSGFAQFRSGDRMGWHLTAEGRKENDRLVAVELDDAGLRAEVGGVYRRFLALNGPMLAACTTWQVTDATAQLLNAHDDAAYDAAVIAELAGIDGEVQPICAQLGAWFERFSSYGPRFANALQRLQAGDIEWFTKPTIESYHTVWFELHEDLLVTLGIDRASERA